MFKTFLKQHDLSEFTFRSDLFPTVEDRDFWENFQYETCVEDAEAVIDYDWPIIKATDFMEYKKSGNRKIMENIHFPRRKYVSLFAMAELIENKGRFLPQITNGLYTICEETYWGISAHWHGTIGNIHPATDPYIDLFAAETAEHLVMIIYMLRKPLLNFCPEIVERVEYELDRRIKTSYEKHRDYYWMANDGSRAANWNPWILSNVLTVYLLSEKDRDRLNRGISKIFAEVQNYYDSVPADGGCDEGPHYWTRACATLFEIIYQLKCATDGALDLFGDPKLPLMAAYMQKAHMVKDVFVNVADCHAVGQGNIMPILYLFAKETNQPQLMDFSVAVYRNKTEKESAFAGSTLRRNIYNSQIVRQMDTHTVTYPIHGALESLPLMELAVLREGDWTMSAKGGFNEEIHNHNDVGSFALYDDSTPVLVDVGISTYTRFTFEPEHRYSTVLWPQAAYHNIPMVNGAQQQYGEQYRSDFFRASQGLVETAFPKAYEKDAGILELDRKLMLSDKGLEITDRFQFADRTKTKITEVLMSVLPVQIVENTAILGENYRISANAGTFRVEQVPFEDPYLYRDWGTDFVNRILIDCENVEEICIKVEKL